MTIINQSEGITKKDLINARASRPFKDLTDYVEVSGVAIAEDVDSETGEPREYGYIFTKEGVFAGSSATVIESLLDVIDILADGDKVAVKAVANISKNDRTFYTLNVR